MRFRSRLKRATLNFLRELAGEPLSTQYQGPMPAIIQEREPLVVMDNKLLAGKNVLITGAGRNIGRSIALEMAKQGANVFFTDINQERCTKLEREFNEYPVQSRGFFSDISKIEDVDSLYNALTQNGVKIDVLVNNAGIQFETKTSKRPDLEEWYKTFDTNVFGPMYLTRLVSHMMESNHINGSIIFITSIHQWTIRRDPSYSASKAAIGMIIKELALDMAPHKIRVNGIAPGWVTVDKQGNPFKNRYAPLHNSTIDPRYVGRAALYLASNYFSKYTTGTVITVDAGLLLYNHIVDQIPF